MDRLIQANVKACGIGDHRFGFATVDMYYVFAAAEAHKVAGRDIVQYADEVAGETSKLKQLYSQSFVLEVYDVCKFAYG